MDIKKIIKIIFTIMLFIVLLIASINTIIIYQIKEDNSTKELINNLVLMQEKMNEHLKEITFVNLLKELESKKEAFIKYELEFESIKKNFEQKNDKDFIDLLISDITDDTIISSKLHLLYESEKQIEVAFDAIYDLEKNKIDLKAKFDRDYPIENDMRKKLDLEIQKSENYHLYKIFSDVKYYSKEALYQKRDRETFDKWLETINLLKKDLNNSDINSYLEVVEKIGNYVILLNEIEQKGNEVKNKIYNVINQNKIYSSEMESKIAQLSTNFINHTYMTILFLLFTIVGFILILGYKVYKNIGLSVDEIETKVHEGIEEIKNLNQEIEQTQKEVVFTMGAIGESRSKETGNHVKRVAEYSKLLALYYGLSKKEAELLKQASPMHDIGKVAIPDDILNKPGRFDEAEREIMNTHAKIGYEMLKHSNRPLLKMASIVAYEHHEKWDGSGYPRGLSGENIHIYGRITALADVFDALGSDRVYKKAWADERIFKMFEEEKGKHFDPKLIDIFFEHLDEFLKIRETFKDVY